MRVKLIGSPTIHRSESKSADRRNNSRAIERPASVPLTEKYAHVSRDGRYDWQCGGIGNYHRLALICAILGTCSS